MKHLLFLLHVKVGMGDRSGKKNILWFYLLSCQFLYISQKIDKILSPANTCRLENNNITWRNSEKSICAVQLRCFQIFSCYLLTNVHTILIIWYICTWLHDFRFDVVSPTEYSKSKTHSLLYLSALTHTVIG